jgi:glycosyltransferase involved in cell wall biosynthesis
MNVVHITPTYFDDSSVIGGGERYPTELALWMSKVTDTTLVSFSSRRKTYRQENLKVEIYPVRHFIHGNRVNPLSLRYLSSIRDADVIHVHHIHTLVSDVACLLASSLGKRVFVTDYGGGGSLTLNRRLPVLEGYQSAIAYSGFGLDFLPAALKEKAVLIKGGIDTSRFCPNGARERDRTILYVGRILPHKGIDYLIEGFRLLNRQDYRLRIIGRIYNQSYYDYIRRLAEGFAVDFVHDASDGRLIDEYRKALVTVLPSVHTSYNGDYTAVPELMGFALLESQACGTPVICTDAGAMREFVNQGQTGFVVEQNSGEAIARAVDKLIDQFSNGEYRDCCREWVKQFEWATVVQDHLRTYESN